MTSILLLELTDFAESELGVAAAARLLIAAAEKPRPDLRSLLAAASQGVEVESLLRQFGRRLFPRFAALYPAFFSGARGWRDLLLEVAPRVHRELGAWHPEGEFPSLRCRPQGASAVEVEYSSPRAVEGLAEGLLLGCLDYFGADGVVSRLPPEGDGASCRFLVEASTHG